jgi:hypothetical protein
VWLGAWTRTRLQLPQRPLPVSATALSRLPHPHPALCPASPTRHVLEDYATTLARQDALAVDMVSAGGLEKAVNAVELLSVSVIGTSEHLWVAQAPWWMQDRVDVGLAVLVCLLASFAIAVWTLGKCGSCFLRRAVRAHDKQKQD